MFINKPHLIHSLQFWNYRILLYVNEEYNFIDNTLNNPSFSLKTLRNGKSIH